MALGGREPEAAECGNCCATAGPGVDVLGGKIGACDVCVMVRDSDGDRDSGAEEGPGGVGDSTTVETREDGGLGLYRGGRAGGEGIVQAGGRLGLDGYDGGTGRARGGCVMGDDGLRKGADAYGGEDMGRRMVGRELGVGFAEHG